MVNQTYAFELSADEIIFLRKIFIDSDVLPRSIRIEAITIGKKHRFLLSGQDAERLRAHLTELLAKVGFGSDYRLTEEGRKLEELIDRFYV